MNWLLFFVLVNYQSATICMKSHYSLDIVLKFEKH